MTKRRAAGARHAVDCVDYVCRREIAVVHAGMHGDRSLQCQGRMMATWSTATRVPTVTCDKCGRVAVAEVDA